MDKIILLSLCGFWGIGIFSAFDVRIFGKEEVVEIQSRLSNQFICKKNSDAFEVDVNILDFRNYRVGQKIKIKSLKDGNTHRGVLIHSLSMDEIIYLIIGAFLIIQLKSTLGEKKKSRLPEETE